MTWPELKLYLICGVGFFLDAYDLFIINQVTPILAYEYFGGLQHKKSPAIPTLLRGAVNASANIGNVIGQVMFGFLGDSFGRKFVYGKELIVAIVGVILTISLPNHSVQPARNKVCSFALAGHEWLASLPQLCMANFLCRCGGFLASGLLWASELVSRAALGFEAS